MNNANIPRPIASLVICTGLLLMLLYGPTPESVSIDALWLALSDTPSTTSH